MGHKSSVKLPYMPFWVNDWETDEKVKAMGPIARAYYVSLLLTQWREGSVPSDREQLKRLLSFPPDPLNQDEILDQVAACFRSNGHPGRMVNKRMALERRSGFAKKRLLSVAGKYGRAKQLMGQAWPRPGQSDSYTEPGPGQATRGSLDTRLENTTRENKRHAPKNGAFVFPLPTWLPRDSWDGYLEMRAKIRKPATERAKEMVMAKLDKMRLAGQDVKAILDQSILNSWQGVFEVRNSNAGGLRPVDPTAHIPLLRH